MRSKYAVTIIDCTVMKPHEEKNRCDQRVQHDLSSHPIQVRFAQVGLLLLRQNNRGMEQLACKTRRFQ